MTPPKQWDLEVASGADDLDAELAKAAIYLAFCSDSEDLPASLRSNIEMAALSQLDKKRK